MVDFNSMSAAQVEWNMAGLLNIELSKLRSNANSFFVAGKYREAIDTLFVMKMTGIHVFDRKERERLEILERKLLLSMMHLSMAASFSPKERLKAMEDISKIRIIFPKYNEMLMDTLHAHGFLGNYKKDSGSMNI